MSGKKQTKKFAIENKESLSHMPAEQPTPSVRSGSKQHQHRAQEF